MLAVARDEDCYTLRVLADCVPPRHRHPGGGVTATVMSVPSACWRNCKCNAIGQED